MESKDIIKIGSFTHINIKTDLCNSCKKTFGKCLRGSHHTHFFGTGEKNDNVAACDAYEPLAVKEPEAK